MGRESFATRLAHGSVDVSRPLVSWWPRHCNAGAQYLAARATSPDGDVIARSREALVALSREWESEVPSAVRRRAGCSLGLMCEHAVLETTLVDAAFKGDPEAIERAGTKLMDNAAAHAGRYSKIVKDFPKGRFEGLMKDHISIFIGMVESLLGNDLKGFERYEKRRDQNAAMIAAFTAEWF